MTDYNLEKKKKTDEKFGPNPTPPLPLPLPLPPRKIKVGKMARFCFRRALIRPML